MNMNINSNQFFDLLGEADSSYLTASYKSMTEKPARVWFRPALIAACLTLVLIAIPVGILIGNRTIKPTVPVIDPTTTTATVPPATTPSETTEAPKASILDIPGATLFENDGRFVTEGGKDSSFDTFYSFTDAQKHEWAYRVKEENEVVVGYVKDYTSVLVPDGKDYYRITTMEIAVLEDFSGIGVETVKAVYANRYKWYSGGDYYPVTKYVIADGIKENTNEVIKDLGVQCDMFQEALFCSNTPEVYPGLILLKDAQNNDLTIGEDTYHLSDYADYVLDACLMYDKGLDRIDLGRDSIHLGFRSGMIREIFFNVISFGGGRDTPFFYFDNSYKAFDGNIAINIRLWKASGTIFYDSIFYDDLFIENEDLTKTELNPEYTWVVTINGVKYEIKRFDLSDTTSATTIYLDLGPDFSFDLFDYDENDQYTYENVRLDIYDSEGNLLCYSPLTNNYRCPGGYTHTKPN